MVNILKALSDRTRLRITALLIDREMCVCEIETCLKLTQSNASRHLTALKQCGILDVNKKAQWAYYKISENFKNEHRDLYEYLKIQFKKHPIYQMDGNELEKCSNQNICAQCKKPH